MTQQIFNKLMLIVTGVLLLITFACDSNTPQRVYASFYKAVQDRNGEIAWQWIDSNSQAAFGNTAFFLNQTGLAQCETPREAWVYVVNKNGAESLPDPQELGDTAIDGKTAVLHFNDDKTINMMKENGQWKIIAAPQSK